MPKPSFDQQKPLPVIVWIHGGGFTQGSGDPSMYGPDRFMDYDVIVVNINYRLGPFGFLSSGTDKIPGNQGIWDQIQALKWVQKNIAVFGGDPNQVTIMGESAGSMSVMSLYVSKESKGLFQKAIAQSGTTNGAFTTSYLHPKCALEKMAKNTNCGTDDLECLQNASTEDIGKIQVEWQSVFANEGYHHTLYKLIDDSKFSSNPIFTKGRS